MQSIRVSCFCCCCSLRTGCIVIGTLGWLMTIFQICYFTLPLREETGHYQNTESDIAAELAYSVITLVICCFLIYGVNNNNKRYIVPWLVLKCMESIAWTTITTIIFILFFVVKVEVFIIVMFLIIFSVTVLNWYFWICVWSLYLELTEDQLTTVIPLEKVQKESGVYSPIHAV